MLRAADLKCMRTTIAAQEGATVDVHHEQLMGWARVNLPVVKLTSLEWEAWLWNAGRMR